MKFISPSFLLLLSLLLGPLIVKSQTDPLFEETVLDSNKMTEAMYDWLELRTEDTTIQSWCISKIENLPDYLDDSAHFYLYIDGFVDSILIEPTDYQYTNDSTYSYTGQMVGVEGWVSFVSKDSLKTALIYYESEYMEYIPFLRNTNLCLRYDNIRYDSTLCEVSTDSLIESSDPIDTSLCRDETCATVIKILILITPQAEDYLGTRGTIDAMSKIWLTNINRAFQNSYIPHLVEGVIVYHNFTNYDPGGKIRQDVLNLRSDNNVLTLRNNHKADLVILITNVEYDDFALGSAYDEVVDSDKAHAIVEVPYIDAPTFTLAHEMGHLFSAHHQRNQRPFPTYFPTDCSFAYKVTGTEFTIMGSVPVVLHYSDPQAKYLTNATGDEVNNNAGKIRKQGCVVANHRSEKNFQLTFRSSGQLKCTPPYLTIEAIIREPDSGFPGQPPYTYEWNRSFKGDFSDEVYLGNTSSIYINSCSISTTRPFFVKVKVTSDDNEVSMLTRKVKCQCQQGSPINPNHRTRAILTAGGIQILTNTDDSQFYPISQVENFPFDQFILFDLSGRTVSSGYIIDNTINLNLDINGLY
ncbi:MAG: hypothetical protein IPM48_02585 [Saprospiraceae bacterium]|nr:hypothetical protein [Saprospiraceae bacterium]